MGYFITCGKCTLLLRCFEGPIWFTGSSTTSSSRALLGCKWLTDTNLQIEEGPSKAALPDADSSNV